MVHRARQNNREQLGSVCQPGEGLRAFELGIESASEREEGRKQ